MSDFPRTVDEITPEWLTSTLRANGHLSSESIAGVVTTELAGGYTGSVVRVELAYSANASGLPQSIVVKIPTSDTKVRDSMGALGLYAQEYKFYRTLAPIVGIDTPKVFFLETDPTGSVGVIGLEDLGHMRNPGTFDPMDMDDSLAAVRAMGSMHAKWWNDSTLLEYDWLVHPGVLLNDATLEDLSSMCESVLNKHSDLLGSETQNFITNIPKTVPLIENAWGNRNTTLCMGDSRGANWFFDGVGENVRAVAIDWQSPSRYSGAVDISYFMTFSRPLEQRREDERELIDSYHQQLIEHGVDNYSLSQLQDDIRWGLFRPLLTMIRVFDSIDAPDDLVIAAEERLTALQDWNCEEMIPG